MEPANTKDSQQQTRERFLQQTKSLLSHRRDKHQNGGRVSTSESRASAPPPILATCWTPGTRTAARAPAQTTTSRATPVTGPRRNSRARARRGPETRTAPRRESTNNQNPRTFRASVNCPSRNYWRKIRKCRVVLMRIRTLNNHLPSF